MSEQTLPLTEAFAKRFAEDWVAAWNAHDMERILAHYRDDFTMGSPFIPGIAGEPSGRLRGKEAVGAYWRAALKRYPDLHFTMHTVFCGADTIAILYTSVGGRNAIEHFRFDANGLVAEASGQYDRL